MKKILACFLFLLPVLNAVYAQKGVLSLDVMPGLMNYGGDLQARRFTFNQACFGMQMGLEYGITSQLSIRAQYLFGKVQGSDKYGINVYDFARNLSFQSQINEGSLTAAYDIFNLGTDKKWTPYVFAGIGVFHFNPYTYDTAGARVYLQPLGTEGEGLPQYPGRKMYALTQINIPVGAGVKFAITSNLTIGAEVGFRKLFTDYLDDVSTNYPDEAVLLAARGPEAVELSFRGNELNPAEPYPSGQRRGNPGSKDYYYTMLFRISYSFISDNTAYRLRKSVFCPRLL